MITELRIRDLGVVDDATIELGPGLTVITGETGAGKTMVVTALALLRGGRGDAMAVRRGAKQLRVEAHISVRDRTDLVEAVAELGGDVEGDDLLVARTVSSDGRSRAYIGGAAVPLATLASFVSALVTLHGQSDQQRLVQPSAQREALDSSDASIAPAAERYLGLYEQLEAIERELAEVATQERERARDIDFLRFGLSEIDAVEPQAGEDIELLAEESRLAHADALARAVNDAHDALSNDDGGDALAALARARALIDGVRDFDESLTPLAERVADALYVLSDLAADLGAYAAGLESDPARLAQVQERRAALHALTRKYGATIDEVLSWAADATDRLGILENADEHVAALAAAREHVEAELIEAADVLSRARIQAAEALSAKVTAELPGLALDGAHLNIAVRRRERRARSGQDDIEFTFAANTGLDPRPLAKAASGGELSRVMLALEVALGASEAPTLIFDEVDAGVGGAAAVEVGRRLARLATHSQVFVVTHLPQVAAFASAHVLVTKSTDGAITSSSVEVLDDPGRERELSRMLAGFADSANAQAHARELLGVARASTH